MILHRAGEEDESSPCWFCSLQAAVCRLIFLPLGPVRAHHNSHTIALPARKRRKSAEISWETAGGQSWNSPCSQITFARTASAHCPSPAKHRLLFTAHPKGGTQREFLGSEESFHSQSLPTNLTTSGEHRADRSAS